MRFLLILQFTGTTLDDDDALVELENSITRKLDGLVEWDGHDFGSAEANIFVGTDEPVRAFGAIKEMPAVSTLAEMRAAFRAKDSDSFRKDVFSEPAAERRPTNRPDGR